MGRWQRRIITMRELLIFLTGGGLPGCSAACSPDRLHQWLVGAAESQGLHGVFVAIKAILPWERRGDEWRGAAEEAHRGDGGRGNERAARRRGREGDREKQLSSTTSLIWLWWIINVGLELVCAWTGGGGGLSKRALAVCECVCAGGDVAEQGAGCISTIWRRSPFRINPFNWAIRKEQSWGYGVRGGGRVWGGGHSPSSSLGMEPAPHAND